MKILWIKAGGLVPPDTGGKIRSYNILRELARLHSVTFFTFYGAHENDSHAELNSIFDRLICVPLALPKPKSFPELVDYGLHLFSPQPYGIKKFCRSDVRRRLNDQLAKEKYDVMVCDFLTPAGIIPWNSRVPIVLFTHNVEAMIWRRHYEVATHPVWKAISWWEWRRMEAAERRYLRLADRVLTVSETDRDAFAPVIPNRSITVIPTGVDVDYFRPIDEREKPSSLVFTGSMDWLPNEDAMFYFVKSIFPLIQQQCPNLSLEIVGRHPSQKMKSLVTENSSVRLTGWVEDIRPYLARASLCIVPLRIGGGTRLKIFEAMAAGKAVVSTTVGAEGLPVESGKNILLADTPEEFANSVLSVLRDDRLKLSLGREARTLVEENYSWRKIAESFSHTLDEVVNLM